MSVHRGVSLKVERKYFGVVLRVGRERRKVTIEQLTAETKVRPEIWRALEANDLSRFPTGIYSRNLVRHYARRVDLDPEELVNEFCRLFPNGNRRAAPTMRAYSAIVGNGGRGYTEPASPGRRAGDPPPVSSWRDVIGGSVAGGAAAVDWLRTAMPFDRSGGSRSLWIPARAIDGRI
jgi:hypothetical protein